MKILSSLIIVFVLSMVSFAKSKNPIVLLETTEGDIYIELFPDKAPKTVENFLKYVKEGFYNGIIFHRVIDGFVIQAGGFDKNFRYKKPTHEPIKNEADNGLMNLRGTIAIARTSDPHSANAQFFINLKDNHFLNHKNKTPQGWGYTVFGRVIKVMEIVDKIAKTPTTIKATATPYGYMRDVPVKPIIILEAKVIEGGK